MSATSTQQQHVLHEEQEQQEWSSLLSDVVLPHLNNSQQQRQQQQQCPGHVPAARPGHVHTARALHRVSRRHRQASCASLRHVSLARYAHGCNYMYYLSPGALSIDFREAAAAAEEAAACVPWSLLSATPCIKSLELTGRQLVLLSDASLCSESGTYTVWDLPSAAAAVAAGAQDPVAAAAAAVGAFHPRLTQLRSLRVSDINASTQLWHLGRLLGSCHQLTQLVLGMAYQMGRDQDPHPGDMLMQGWWSVEREPPPAAAAAAGGGGRGGEGGAGVAEQLPPIQHLELSSPCAGVLDALLSEPGVGAQLTALHMTFGGAAGQHAFHLDQCSGLQELVVDCSPDRVPDPDLPEHLAPLTALTKLVLKGCELQELPDSLWRLTALQHLSVGHNHIAAIPSDISCLQQLRRLDLKQTGLWELPGDLGTWLPQLVELDITSTCISSVPSSLTRLTRLVARAGNIQRVSGIQHLVGLKELLMDRGMLLPPITELSRLGALETLQLGWISPVPEWTPVSSLQGYWPRLRSLTINEVPQELLAALLEAGGMSQLTYLSISELQQSHVQAIPQLGVLPELQEVWLRTSSREDGTSWAPAAAWLQQQPKAVEVYLGGGVMDGPQLEQLPTQLEVLSLSDVGVVAEDLVHLTHLRHLWQLSMPDQLTQLPPWLSRLEVLFFGPDIESGWEVLAELPLLRRVMCMPWHLKHAPHLCWS